MCVLKDLLRLMLVALVGIGLSGCDSSTVRSGKVSGTVVVDGELAHGGTVTFHPVKAGPLAIGRILSDGSFTVRTGQGDLSDVDGGTVNPGEYTVTIVVTGDSGKKIGESGPPKAGPRLTAAKYASSDTSGLVRTVKAGENLFIFELDGARTDEPDMDSESTDSTASDSDENSQQDETEDSETESTEGEDKSPSNASNDEGELSSDESADESPAEEEQS